MTQIIALLIYWPFARLALLAELFGIKVDSVPLSYYRRLGFYVMRTDALDRFGTRLEQRFTKGEMIRMMEDAGLENITFNEQRPYWTVIGYKR